jgi:hypothetical protein
VTTAKWVPVPGTVGRYNKDSKGSVFQKLFGSDGDSLVFAKEKDGKLYWSKPAAN